MCSSTEETDSGSEELSKTVKLEGARNVQHLCFEPSTHGLLSVCVDEYAMIFELKVPFFLFLLFLN
jgi:hypothetical protein